MGQKFLLKVREGSGGTPGGYAHVQRTGGRETLEEVQDGLGGPRTGPVVVGSPTRRSGTIWEAFPVVRDGSVVPPRGPAGFRRPSQRFWWGREAHPEVLVGSGGTPGSSEGPPGGRQ